MYISTLMISLCIINHLYCATAVPRIRCQDPTSKRSLPSWELTYIIYMYIYIYIYISHVGERKIIFERDFWWDMSVARRVFRWFTNCALQLLVVKWILKFCTLEDPKNKPFFLASKLLSHEKKKTPTFHHTGYYFIEILIMVYFNPHIYIYI